MNKLKVKAVGDKLFPQLDSVGRDGQMRRFVGRVFDAQSNAFVSTNEAEEVANNAEYRQAVKDGDLKAADKATADLCGTTLDEKKEIKS